ncbi:unnamed protein product [Amoebophrya sp. A25]|nr:unnamed protein product [Amoebophrya sp. A25]|eukprot:GSA25T00005836001.1
MSALHKMLLRQVRFFAPLVVYAEVSVDFTPPPTKTCSDEPWAALHKVLNVSAAYPDGGQTKPSPDFEAYMRSLSSFTYFRENFRECREGFLSFLFYMSLHHNEHKQSFRTLANDFSRELNPLALRQPELLSWPMFGQVESLSPAWDVEDNNLGLMDAIPKFQYLVPLERPRWQRLKEQKAGQKNVPTRQKGLQQQGQEVRSDDRETLVPHHPVTRISGMAGMVHSEHGLTGSLDLLRRLAEPTFAEREQQSQAEEKSLTEDGSGGVGSTPVESKDIEEGSQVSKNSRSEQPRPLPVRSQVILDVGTFDGSDWAKAIVESGFLGIGFEMVARNRALMMKNFEHLDRVEGAARVVPGERAPDARFKQALDAILDWRKMGLLRNGSGEANLAQPMPNECGAAEVDAKDSASCQADKKEYGEGISSEALEAIRPDERGRGFFHLVGAALGKEAKKQRVLSRYDYTSLALMGYLDGPPDMEEEAVAVVTLDDLFATGYFPSSLKIDVLKIDTEGFELGVLKGAEAALRDTRVHFLIFEYQPAMLSTTGTDHEDILHFVAHYGFHCYSLKLPSIASLSFAEFAVQYERPDRLQLKGMGAIEDIICENRYWTPEPIINEL